HRLARRQLHRIRSFWDQPAERVLGHSRSAVSVLDSDRVDRSVDVQSLLVFSHESRTVGSESSSHVLAQIHYRGHEFLEFCRINARARWALYGLSDLGLLRFLCT